MNIRSRLSMLGMASLVSLGVIGLATSNVFSVTPEEEENLAAIKAPASEPQGPSIQVDGTGTANYGAKWIDSDTLGIGSIFDNGNVGIGDITPLAKFTVGDGDKFRVTSGGLVRSVDGTAATPTYSFASDTNTGIYRAAAETLALATNGSQRVTVDINGNVGIGTISPRRQMEIAGDGVRFVDDDPYGSSSYGDVRFEDKGTGGLVLDSNTGGTWADMTFQTNHATRMFIEASNGNVGIGTISPDERLTVNGTVKATVLTVTGGADLAEAFDVRSQAAIQPGMAVVIDAENKGSLTVSSKAYDRRVAGIVSGANGIQPGMTLSQEQSQGHGTTPIALTGRVYALADASAGAITTGDLLTTSNNPGHLMKVADPIKGIGTTVGKAMSDLSSGQGYVLVLVSLQ